MQDILMQNRRKINVHAYTSNQHRNKLIHYSPQQATHNMNQYSCKMLEKWHFLNKQLK